MFMYAEYLIEHLELMKPDDTENVTWAFQTMLEVGVSFSDLLTIYEGYVIFISTGGSS